MGFIGGQLDLDVSSNSECVEEVEVAARVTSFTVDGDTLNICRRSFGDGLLNGLGIEIFHCDCRAYA